MGGDNPAAELVRGAVAGARECGAALTLVGDKTEIRRALDGFKANIIDAQYISPSFANLRSDSASASGFAPASAITNGCDSGTIALSAARRRPL